jgi:hypothetical protein
MTYPLGRIYLPDQRDRGYPMAKLLSSPAPTRTTPWHLGPILDQGETPRCTAFAWRAWLNAEPLMDPPDMPPPDDEFYRQEQAVDGAPGPHEGSTVRAGAKVISRSGRLGEYLWADNVIELSQWLLTRSPAVMGTNWYAGMDSPSNGVVSVSGELRGGHSYLCYWYDVPTRLFLCQNSWGPEWGKNGLFAIPAEGMARLLSEQGEACGAVEVPPRILSWPEQLLAFLRQLMMAAPRAMPN